MSKLSDLNIVPKRGNDDKIVQVMDPVHNFIDISEYPVIQQLIDTPYFQRLRRLHQLGLASTVYPNATHSRFAHSIGVMHVFLVMFDSIVKRSKLPKRTIEKLRPIGAVAALLHDIGHGPFSHVSEKILENGEFDHESLTREIILNTEIHDILKVNKIESKLVCDVLKHQVVDELRFVSQLISSQLDADRIDYLIRDALFTGVPYGKIDIYRIANTLSIWNYDAPAESLKGTIVVSKKGIEAIENYLIGRYHMYKGVYYHKTVRCMENILIKTFKCASKLKKERTMIIDTSKKITPKSILAMDDYLYYSAIHSWRNSSNKTLKDLSSRIINRDLLKVWRPTKSDIIKNMADMLPDIKKEYKKNNLNSDYYFIVDPGTRYGYKPYVITDQNNELSSTSHIMVDMGDCKLKEISEVSSIVKATSQENVDNVRIFTPENILPSVKKMLTPTH